MKKEEILESLKWRYDTKTFKPTKKVSEKDFNKEQTLKIYQKN